MTCAQAAAMSDNTGYLALVAHAEKAEARVKELEGLIAEVLDKHCCTPQDWGERAEKLLDRWRGEAVEGGK